MGGVLLSLVWISVVSGMTVLVFHRRVVTQRFRVMCRIFAGGLIGFVVSYFVVPSPCLGVPVRSEPVVEFLNGLYCYHFWFFGVFAQLYSLADRGFSLTILTDFLTSGAASRTREEIKHMYAGGKGMAYVKQKRIEQIIHGGFIRREHQTYVSTSLGWRVGRLFQGVQRLYRFQETG